VNAPPPVHERVAAAVDACVRHVIVSGIVTDEMPDVVKRYEAAGFSVAQGLGTEDEWIALRLSC
jgi:ribosomal protein L11 methyltransferase